MKRYLTEEELQRLMDTTEARTVYAPAHLKESILQKIEAENRLQKKRQRNSAPEPFPIYSAKIIAGMAAAILLAFTLPQPGSGSFSQAYGSRRQQEWEARRNMTQEERLLEMEQSVLEKWLGQLIKQLEQKK